jgi:hypothetical protein
VSDRRARVPRVEVRVSAPPRPGLLRPAIAHRLAGRAFVPGAEDEVGAAVARAVADARAGRPRWP